MRVAEGFDRLNQEKRPHPEHPTDAPARTGLEPGGQLLRSLHAEPPELELGEELPGRASRAAHEAQDLDGELPLLVPDDHLDYVACRRTGLGRQDAAVELDD